MNDPNTLIGFWEIIDCGIEATRSDGKGVVNAVFQLTPTGDVAWKLPDNPKSIPLFCCDTYEFASRGPYLSNLLRFGSYRGNIIEFRIEKYKADSKMLTLHEGLFYMTCLKLDRSFADVTRNLEYNLLPALEDGYFSDLCIVSNYNSRYRLHLAIVTLTANEIDWTTEPPPFSGLPDEVIDVVVHYLYTQCLPREITERTARHVIMAASEYPGLDPLITMCESYVKNVLLTKELVSLMREMHAYGDQITENFIHNNFGTFFTSPAEICSALKNSLSDLAVAITKIFLFCDTFNKKREDVSLLGRHEIVRYIKSRIPIFVSQIDKFFDTVKSTFGNLAAAERYELAHHLLPEMDKIFKATIDLMLKARSFLEAVLADCNRESEGRIRVRMGNLKQHMDKLVLKKQISKLRFVLHKMDCIIVHLHKKKEDFIALDPISQVRALSRNLEHLIERLPFFLLRIEEIADDFDERLDWNESQFFFKVSAVRIAEILQYLVDQKHLLRGLSTDLCKIVQRDEFSQALISLGLLEPDIEFLTAMSEKRESNRVEERALNLTEYLFESPRASTSALAKAALRAFKDTRRTDMIFEIIEPEEPLEIYVEPSDTETSDDETSDDDEESEESSVGGELEEGAVGGELEEGAVGGELEEGAVGGELEEGAAGGELEEGAVGGELEEGAVGGELEEGAVGGELEEGAVGGESEEDDVGGYLGYGVYRRRFRNDTRGKKSKRKKNKLIVEDCVPFIETNPSTGPEHLVVDAHRVIVSSRCNFFRRALLSGMLESIERKIRVHNVDIPTFYMFLDYLYSGEFDFAAYPIEQIVQLLRVADCFDVGDFKESCENALLLYLSNRTALSLLGVGENYHAIMLKVGCMRYLSRHSEVSLASRAYLSLSPPLQAHVYDVIVWARRYMALINRYQFGIVHRGYEPDFSFTNLRALALEMEQEEARNGVDYGSRFSLVEDPPFAEDPRYINGMRQMREVIGPNAQRSRFSRLILAADFNVNRALNYYFMETEAQEE